MATEIVYSSYFVNCLIINYYVCTVTHQFVSPEYLMHRVHKLVKQHLNAEQSFLTLIDSVFKLKSLSIKNVVSTEGFAQKNPKNIKANQLCVYINLKMRQTLNYVYAAQI